MPAKKVSQAGARYEYIICNLLINIESNLYRSDKEIDFYHPVQARHHFGIFNRLVDDQNPCDVA